MRTRPRRRSGFRTWKVPRCQPKRRTIFAVVDVAVVVGEFLRRKLMVSAQDNCYAMERKEEEERRERAREEQVLMLETGRSSLQHAPLPLALYDAHWGYAGGAVVDM
jgi:hypothetical protein